MANDHVVFDLDTLDDYARLQMRLAAAPARRAGAGRARSRGLLKASARKRLCPAHTDDALRKKLDKRISADGREVRAMAQEIFDVVNELRARREPFAVATVIEAAGSASATTGAKAVIGHTGRVVAGWVGGGCAESTACLFVFVCLW